MTPFDPHHHLDADLNRTLAALGAADPTPGLDTRILAALAHARPAQAARRAGKSLGPRRLASASHPVQLAFACVLAAAALSAMYTLRTAHLGQPAQAPAAASSPARSGTPHTALNHGTVLDTLTAPERESTRISPGSSEAAASPTTPTQPGTTATSTLSPEDAIALAEMQAPSLPAPPEPLTPQERLLQRATHIRGVVALAEPDDDEASHNALLAEQARRQAETHAFFATLSQGLFAGIGQLSPEPAPTE